MQPFQSEAKLFKLLMHPTRLAILEILRGGEQCVCHMEAKLGLRQAAISQQLMMLREAGWVTDRRDGWNIFYRVIKPEIYSVVDTMRTISGQSPEPGSWRKEAACPCPKCNPDAVFVKLEVPEQVVKESKSTE